MKRICLQWPRFGPYHLARLRATHRYFGDYGVEVVGLETAGQDATYSWNVEDGALSFRHETVFPNRIFDELTPREIHAAVTVRLDELNPDAVAINSYGFPDARACLVWCRRNRRTAVVMCDSKFDDAPRAAWREKVKSLIISQFDAALLAGIPHRAYFEKLGFSTKAIFLGCDVVDNDFFQNGADLARLQPETYAHLPGLESDTPFFLTSSRFIPRKNLDVLIRAYRIYRKQEKSPWRLVLLGDGPERQNLERMIRAKSIEGVTLAGFHQAGELPAYYGLAGVFVHPPRIEQWGLVVNEAMAAGLPVLVSARAGCAADLVRDGENGYRFNPDEPEELARLLSHVTAPDTDRDAMGRRSQETISKWSLDRFAEKLWVAFQRGEGRADRGMKPTASVIMWALSKIARTTNSFHSIDV